MEYLSMWLFTNNGKTLTFTLRDFGDLCAMAPPSGLFPFQVTRSSSSKNPLSITPDMTRAIWGFNFHHRPDRNDDRLDLHGAENSFFAKTMSYSGWSAVCMMTWIMQHFLCAGWTRSRTCTTKLWWTTSCECVFQIRQWSCLFLNKIEFL